MEIYLDTITQLSSDPPLDLKTLFFHGEFLNLGFETSTIGRLFGVRFNVGGETFLIWNIIGS